MLEELKKFYQENLSIFALEKVHLGRERLLYRLLAFLCIYFLTLSFMLNPFKYESLDQPLVLGVLSLVGFLFCIQFIRNKRLISKMNTTRLKKVKRIGCKEFNNFSRQKMITFCRKNGIYRYRSISSLIEQLKKGQSKHLSFGLIISIVGLNFPILHNWISHQGDGSLSETLNSYIISVGLYGYLVFVTLFLWWFLTNLLFGYSKEIIELLEEICIVEVLD